MQQHLKFYLTRFLNPVGHFGLIAVMRLTVFPFTQVIVFFVAGASVVVVGIVVVGALARTVNVTVAYHWLGPSSSSIRTV
jgi:hypothetical protein